MYICRKFELFLKLLFLRVLFFFNGYFFFDILLSKFKLPFGFFFNRFYCSLYYQFKKCFLSSLKFFGVYKFFYNLYVCKNYKKYLFFKVLRKFQKGLKKYQKYFFVDCKNMKKLKYTYITKYLLSHGFFKLVRIKTKYSKGYIRYMSVGYKSYLRFKRRSQYLVRFKSLVYKFKYSVNIMKFIKPIIVSSFNVFFICLTKNINIQSIFGFSKSFIKMFYCQLIFLFTKFLEFKTVLERYLDCYFTAFKAKKKMNIKGKKRDFDMLEDKKYKKRRGK